MKTDLYLPKRKKNVLGFTIFFIILLAVSFFSLFLGSEKISPVPFFTHNLEVDPFDKLIIFELRLPRILLCIICGALLGGCGSLFQGFFRNPLADSGILGISSGATLGVILSSFFASWLNEVFTWKFLSPISLFAFFGGICSGLLIFFVSLTIKKNSNISLLLIGTAIGTFLSSICSLLIIAKQKNIQSILMWTMGSFNSKSWDDFYLFIIPSIVSLVLICCCSKSLDLLGSGEKTAISLGLNLPFLKVFVLLVGSLATSCAVCEGGIISFVGLICPHIVRKIFGSEHKTLIPLSMICGSVLTLISDTVARTLIAPAEIPVGIITSLLGVPFFIIILISTDGGKNA